jgi:aminopeptidase
MDMLGTDKRWKQFGEVLINYCVSMKKGEKVIIAMVEPETWPLALATYEAAVKAGGYPQIQLKSEYLRRAIMKYGTEEQVSWAPDLELLSIDWADCYVALRGGNNMDIFHDIPTEILAKNQAAHGFVSSERTEKTRWVLTRVPNAAFAQQAGMDLETISDMYFDSVLLDYPTVNKDLERWIKKLEGSEKVHIIGKNTDLSFVARDKEWTIDRAEFNIPGGEIANHVVNETLDGQIYFENPAVLGGQLMYDTTIEWKNGKFVNATSSTNQEYLNRIIATDNGSNLLGEFAFGTNPGLASFTNDILWDEKIYGTVHVALGRDYMMKQEKPENFSKIHWDIVKDMRQQGEVIIDGVTVLRNGRLLFDEI